MSFRITYIGQQEIEISTVNIDDILEDAYSKYKKDVEIADFLAIVGYDDLHFRNLVDYDIDIAIPLASIQSVCDTYKHVKYPQAVIVVCTSPTENSTIAHVLHCESKIGAIELSCDIARGTKGAKEKEVDEAKPLFRGKSTAKSCPPEDGKCLLDAGDSEDISEDESSSSANKQSCSKIKWTFKRKTK